MKTYLNLLSNKTTQVLIQNFVAINLLFFTFFGRSYSGLTILNFRFGEIFIGLSILLFFNLLFYINFIELKFLRIFLYFLFISFIISALISDSNFLNLYTYKSSSYIWTLGFLLFGIILFSNIDYDFWLIKFSPFVLIIVYFLSTVRFPKSIASFFIQFSDKFEYLKGSDLLIIFVAFILISKRRFINKYFFLTYFLLLSSLYVPLFIFKSKGAVLPGVIFIIFELLVHRGYILANKVKFMFLILLCIPTFVIGIYTSFGSFDFQIDPLKVEKAEKPIVPSAKAGVISQDLKKLVELKNTNGIFLSIFINDGRIYSTDAMANWRLQIWQDVVEDLYKQNGYFFGYGYKDIIPAMDEVERRGTDGTNENVHNFLVNIFARGGLVQVILFIYFYLLVFKYYLRNNNSYNLIIFILCSLGTAFFDTAMESVRFPFIFYTVIPYFLYEKKIYIE